MATTSSKFNTVTTKPSSLSRVTKKFPNRPTLSSPHRQTTNNAATTDPDTNMPTSSMSPHPHPPPHKRSKLTPQSVKTRRVQPIERDAQGHPKLPQQIGVLTVHHLGTIVTNRPNYHNERYIFPVGYSVSRYVSWQWGGRSYEKVSCSNTMAELILVWWIPIATQ